MGYRHFEVETVQSPKYPESPCGDAVACERSATGTTVVVSDGLGSGVKANIAATMCVSRMLEYTRRGVSLRQGFSSLVQTMNRARGTDLPYAVFTVIRILPDGAATVLSYEMPPVVLAGLHTASALPRRTFTLGSDVIGESHCHLEPGEGILAYSDGITQAGMGLGLTWGWTEDGVARFVSDRLARSARLRDLPRAVHDEARTLWGRAAGDDCTAVGVICRPGRTVTIFTGPPSAKNLDYRTARRFLLSDGVKVVCGATTAKIVAAHSGAPLDVEQDAKSVLAPPRYSIEGIDLVTEGAVTLTQVYNVLGENPDDFEEESGVSELAELLLSADRIEFIVGSAKNPASDSISFRQRGILSRDVIVPLIAEKLKAMGKLVVVGKV